VKKLKTLIVAMAVVSACLIVTEPVKAAGCGCGSGGSGGGAAMSAGHGFHPLQNAYRVFRGRKIHPLRTFAIGR